MLYAIATIISLASAPIAPTSPLVGVPFTQVTIEDKFWALRRKINREISVPHSLKMLETQGYLTNFELAAKGKTTGFIGLLFMDSDLYKVLESASYVLAETHDPALDKKLDEIIAIVGKAQQPDGYLNTYFQVDQPGKRWTNLRDTHELYCAGHLFEAAVAHYRATGKKNLLDIATKYADCIYNTFGPGKREGYCGHPEIELALVKLADVTKDDRYFQLANFFVTTRGSHFFAREHNTPEARYDGTYWLDDVPIRDHSSIKGHAVRAAYLMSGATDVAARTRDAGLLAMLDRVWSNVSGRNTYLTGGIGPSAHNEGFTSDYDLPNRSAYQETCATVALAQWNRRMGLLHAEAKYADRVEQGLYNALPAGVSLSGDKFFYVNPLESGGNHHRSEWFACACCPPNETRTLASLGDYIYATGAKQLVVNLYVQGTGHAKVGGKDAKWRVTSEYPWQGAVDLAMENGLQGDLWLRIPSWCDAYSLKRDGAIVSKPVVQNGYAVLAGPFKSGAKIHLDLAMPVRRVVANPKVAEDRGLAAFARGPIVFCFEGVDQKVPLQNVWIPAEAPFKGTFQPSLLGGVMVLDGEGRLPANWPGGLYSSLQIGPSVKLRAVPYAVWDNRSPGVMKVWMPYTPPVAKDQGLEARAEIKLSFTSGNCDPQGINDGMAIKNSSEQPGALCHFWPHKGTSEWVQYTWKQPIHTAQSSVYWFDDTGRGECRLPASWSLEYWKDGKWEPVQLANSAYDIKLDGWCTVKFAPISTNSMRLKVTSKPNWASGMHEWRVDSIGG